MAQRLDFPYWANWVSWHVYERFREKRRVQRKVVWDFINFIRTLPRGALAIDCGANIGRVTAALARQHCEVHAFEPDPLAMKILKSRFGSHPNVHLHNVAVGAQGGFKASLYRAQHFTARPKRATVASSLIKTAGHTTQHCVEVDIIDLIEFIRRLDRPVDVLKLDVEGAEVEIVERLFDEGLDRQIGAMFVETHERFSDDLACRTQRLRSRVAREGMRHVNLDWC